MARYEKINEDLQSMGYKDIPDFYEKNPSSNFDVTPLTTKLGRKVVKGVRYVGRKIKNKIKRYE